MDRKRITDGDTISPVRTYVIEGELVHDYWQYEYNVLEVDGKDIQDFIFENIGEPLLCVPDKIIPLSAQKNYYPRVRLTLEIFS